MKSKIKELEIEHKKVDQEIKELSELGITMFSGGSPRQRSRYSELFDEAEKISSEILWLKVEEYKKSYSELEEYLSEVGEM